MAFDYKVYKSRRIIPLRFKRAVTGQPVLGKPDIDNRGYYRAAAASGNDHGHVVGVTEGNESEVEIERVSINKKAELYVTSSDPAVMTVTDSGGTDKLASSNKLNIKIKGVKGNTGANPETAKVEVRYASKAGQVIGEISVWVFKKRTVKLTPHNVTIRTATASGIASSANINNVINMVKAVWEPCGVDFTVDPIQNDTITLASAGVVNDIAEINMLLGTNYVTGSINAYFVNQLSIPDIPANPAAVPPTPLIPMGGVLGLGLSRPSSVGFTNPGIILGDTNRAGTNRSSDVHWLANDLAHEIGHFFTLPHIDRRDNNNPRSDTWAVRMLMHPSNKRASQGNWRDDVGYGNFYRGALITMKDVVGFSTDAESLQARGVIINPPGPY